jgi:hypothetical protein
MRVIGGLAWPEDGHPAFYCLVAEKVRPREASIETPERYFEIIHEFKSENLPVLFEDLRPQKKVEVLYAPNDAKYYSYIREFTKWRRSVGGSIMMKASNISSFEAGVIKIKELVLGKIIIFPEGSMVRRQLKVFSRLSLKEEREFYGVSALTHCIGAFRQPSSAEPVKELSMRLWY